MKSLLAIAFVLLASPCFAVLTRTYTVCESGGGCDYTTLAAAETAHQQDLPANDSALTFEMQNTWVSADGTVVIAAWTMDATRFLTATAVGAARATATWSATAYRIEGAVSGLLQIDESFVVIDGIQIKTTSSADIGIRINEEGITVKNCFVTASAQTNSRGMFVNNATATGVVIRNSVIIDCGLEGVKINAAATGGVTIDNNTIENCGDGLETTDDDGICRNNIFINTAPPLVGNWNTSTLSEENYTDEASISYGSCGSCGTGDQVSQSDPFINLAGENYGLTGSATALNTGKDLSGDFTDSINGVTRPQGSGYDKGAFELLVSAGGTRVGIRN